MSPRTPKVSPRTSQSIFKRQVLPTRDKVPLRCADCLLIGVHVNPKGGRRDPALRAEYGARLLAARPAVLDHKHISCIYAVTADVQITGRLPSAELPPHFSGFADVLLLFFDSMFYLILEPK